MKRYLKYDVNFEDLIFTKEGDDLLVSSKKFKNVDRVKNYFTDDNPLNLVKTADREIAHSLKDDMILRIFPVQNENGSHNIEGTFHNNIITGSNNDDIITGNEGDDIIYGGKGADTFIFNLGDGKDVIKDSENSDVIHINAALENLKYTRTGNDLEIAYSDEDTITLTNFFKNKTSKNIDMIKNLSGDIQAEYEDYITNPPYEESYYLNQYQRIYILKVFMSEDGYELCEKSILRDAKIDVGEKNVFVGTDYSENVSAQGKSTKFSLGAGYDTIIYGSDFEKSVVTVGKNETLNLKFDSDIDFDYKISKNNLVLTTDKETLTLKDFLRRVNDSSVMINGKSITSYKKYLEMLTVDASDFKKGKYTGTTLNDNIDASNYVSKNKKTGVVINSKSGSDTVVGSMYNDTIKVASIDGDRTTVTEYGGVNKITTGAGRDTISVYNDSSNTINAGEGKNVITLSSTGKNKYTGGNGIERVTVTAGTNTINMKNGYNTIDISGGINTVTGGKDNDVVNVTGGENKISTGAGYDKISLSGGYNILDAGAGNDSIKVSGGDAVLNGGEGNDLYDFMDYYNRQTSQFNGHVDIIDTKGESELRFYDRMFFEEKPVETDDGFIRIARLDGRPIVYFDVSVDQKGQTVVGKDILFTLSKSFTGFDGNGVHLTDMSTISGIEAVNLSAIYYMPMASEYGTDPLDPEVPYYRPNYGESASARYTLDVTELSEMVAGWLTSDSNTDGYKSAMEVFTKGNETQIAELTAIYTDNATSCYKSL